MFKTLKVKKLAENERKLVDEGVFERIRLGKVLLSELVSWIIEEGDFASNEFGFNPSKDNIKVDMIGVLKTNVDFIYERNKYRLTRITGGGILSLPYIIKVNLYKDSPSQIGSIAGRRLGINKTVDYLTSKTGRELCLEVPGSRVCRFRSFEKKSTLRKGMEVSKVPIDVSATLIQCSDDDARYEVEYDDVHDILI